MVEIEQEEYERLIAVDKAHKELSENHAKLVKEHEELKVNNGQLKDDYIKLCKGQQQGLDNKPDDFDALCAKKFGK